MLTSLRPFDRRNGTSEYLRRSCSHARFTWPLRGWLVMYLHELHVRDTDLVHQHLGLFPGKYK
jgi:hypothetical protein